MMNTEITFSFGENWSNYIRTIDEATVHCASKDIQDWLSAGAVKGKRVIDVGCGSGIHSLCFCQLGAREVISFDYDRKSVDATNVLWQKAGKPAHWLISTGSVLDDKWIASLGKFDVVYSWGVLHHTGDMWEAIKNAIALLDESGLFWISIYTKGPNYQKDLAKKIRFNQGGYLRKHWMMNQEIWKCMNKRYQTGRNPFQWNQRVGRGMSPYYDIVDWLGGLPYEVASKEEIISYCAEAGGLSLKKVKEAPEAGCSIYLFERA